MCTWKATTTTRAALRRRTNRRTTMTHTSNRVAAAFIACLAAPLSAQAPSWFLPHNQVAPSVTTTVSLDASGDFRYRYTVGNGAGAAQRINKFFLELALPASATAAPTDWY